ncbi:hypothetical protein [Amycolatopsis minnesotensis]|uniref:Uncharacterized protein n=1 Tax=Amycolatopsis minnesotensis TaxID=337894 RepID=A0ABN2S9M2_9PSEU
MDSRQERLDRVQRLVDTGALPLEDAARELAEGSEGGLTLVGARDTLAHHRTISPPVPSHADKVAVEATIAEIEAAARATAGGDERDFHAAAADALYARYVSLTCDPYLSLPYTPTAVCRRTEARGKVLVNRALHHRGLAVS